MHDDDIARFDVFGRFRVAAVDLDSAAVAGVLRDGAAFNNELNFQKFVDSHYFSFIFVLFLFYL